MAAAVRPEQQGKFVADRQTLAVSVQRVLGPTLEGFVAVLIREAIVIVVGQIQIEQRILVKAPELIDVGDGQLVLKLKRAHAMLGPEVKRDAIAAELDFLGKLLPHVAQQDVDRRIRELSSQGAEPAVRRLARRPISPPRPARANDRSGIGAARRPAAPVADSPVWDSPS